MISKKKKKKISEFFTKLNVYCSLFWDSTSPTFSVWKCSYIIIYDDYYLLLLFGKIS